MERVERLGVWHPAQSFSEGLDELILCLERLEIMVKDDLANHVDSDFGTLSQLALS